MKLSHMSLWTQCPKPISLSIILIMQSGDVQPGTVLTLTIIPVHDDNIDLQYEPVSYVNVSVSVSVTKACCPFIEIC